MASAARRPCTHPGCGALTTTGRCEAHPRRAWLKREPVRRTLVGRALQAKRAEFIGRDPFCALHRKRGELVRGAILDHVVPLEEGGTDDDDNLQWICRECSDAKTAAEARRGRDRGGYLKF